METKLLNLSMWKKIARCSSTKPVMKLLDMQWETTCNGSTAAKNKKNWVIGMFSLKTCFRPNVMLRHIIHDSCLVHMIRRDSHHSKVHHPPCKTIPEANESWNQRPEPFHLTPTLHHLRQNLVPNKQQQVNHAAEKNWCIFRHSQATGAVWW